MVVLLQTHTQETKDNICLAYLIYSVIYKAYHDGFTVASKSVLKEFGENGVTVWNYKYTTNTEYSTTGQQYQIEITH